MIATVLVDSIPAPVESGWAFDGIVRIERPERAPDGVSAALWDGAFRARLISRAADVRPQAGDRWRLLLSLRAPRGRANPGGVDFERSLFRDGVNALGTVVGSSLNAVLDSGHRPLTRWREEISSHIDARVTDRDASALIAALAVGDTGRVSREQWRVFNATGTTHLVAISGLHVTLFAVIMFALARRVWGVCVTMAAPTRPPPESKRLSLAPPGARASMRPPAPRVHALACLSRAFTWTTGPVARHVRRLGCKVSSVPRETFAAFFGFFAAAGYAALAGLSVPTERTLIMLGVWLFARSCARASHPFQAFAWALWLVLIVDPFAPLSAGFWLSFVAMAAIILSASGRVVPVPRWREALSVQLVVSIALLPFTLALFGSVPLIGFPVNLVAIPAMSWVLVPTVLLAVALLPVSTLASDAVLSLAEWLHNLGWKWLAAASDTPWALIHASPPWWWYALAACALAMAALPWPLLMRLAPLICISPLAAAIERPVRMGSAEITVLDAGDGFAAVVRTAAHTLVYGTGDSYGTNGRVADGVVVPFLRSSGVHSVDRLVIPRPSVAAGAGVVALLAEVPIRQTLAGDAVDTSTTDCTAVPTQWTWDGVTFVLRASGDGGHACALSVRTAAGGGEVRLLGDIDAAVVESARDLGNTRLDGDPSPGLEHGGSDGDAGRARSGPFDRAGVVAGSGPAARANRTDPTSHRRVVVSSRRAQRALEKYARNHPELEGAEVLVTADQGAMRVPLDSARGPAAPEAYRAHRRTLWSAAP